MEIVLYTNEYAETVRELILDVYENEMGFVGYERPDIHAISETYMQPEQSNFWIAIDSGEVVGTVGLLTKSSDLAYIKRMVLKKEYRGQGLGHDLLRTAIDFARSKNIQTIYAGTVEENPGAIAFYERNGFVRTDDIPEDITAAKDSVCLALMLQ